MSSSSSTITILVCCVLREPNVFDRSPDRKGSSVPDTIRHEPRKIVTKRQYREKPQQTWPPSFPRVETEGSPTMAAHRIHEVQMKSMITTAALTGIFALSMVAEASAWERKGSVTGPRGTNTFNAQGSCSGSSCYRSATATGAYGRTATRTGSASCSGNSCSGSRTTTGPAGNSVKRTRSFSW